MREVKRYEFRGKLMTAGEIATTTGVAQGLISGRLFRGVRGEALAAPPLSRTEAAKLAKKAMHGGTACRPKTPRQPRRKP